MAKLPELDTTKRVDQEAAADERDYPEAETMFDEVFSYGGLSDSFREFLESIHEWYEDKGFLTPKQLDALKKAYDNIKG